MNYYIMNYYTYLAFIIAFLWGLSPVLFKFIIQKNIPPYIIIFIQAFVYLCASIIYIALYKNDKIYEDLSQNINFVPFLIIISLSVYMANVLYLYALEKQGNVNIMAIIISLAPLITILFSYLILREKASSKIYIGFFIIFVGLIFIFAPI